MTSMTTLSNTHVDCAPSAQDHTQLLTVRKTSSFLWGRMTEDEPSPLLAAIRVTGATLFAFIVMMTVIASIDVPSTETGWISKHEASVRFEP